MPRAPVELDHHALHLGRHDRDLRILAGEGLNRLQRLPARDDQELDAALDVAPQDRRVDESRDARELREGVLAQMRDVGFRVLAPGKPAPMSRDQAGKLSAELRTGYGISSFSMGSGRVLRDTTQSPRELSVNVGALAHELNEM